MSTNTDADGQSWEKGKEKLSDKGGNTVLHKICFAYITFQEYWFILFQYTLYLVEILVTVFEGCDHRQEFYFIYLA